MKHSFDVKKYETGLKGLSPKTIALLADRNAWRALILAGPSIREYNNKTYIIYILNSRMIVSFLNADAARTAADAAAADADDTNTRLIKQIYLDFNKAQAGNLSFYSPVFGEDSDFLIQNLVNIIKEIDSKFEFYVPFIERRLTGADLTDDDIRLMNALGAVTQEKYNQGAEAVFEFIQAHYEGKLSQKVNIARVIFIGPGGAGKTSLIRALNDQKVVVGEEKPTPGISTSKWIWGKDCDIDIRFWDFAGQVTTHAMHKFFLRERCLYVLLLTTRDDQALETQAEYWLEHVRLYGGKSPVLVVANKIDCDSKVANFNEQLLKTKYPSIIGFKKITAAKAKSSKQIQGTTYRKLFNEFRGQFIQAIKDVVNQYKNELSTEEDEVKEALFKIDSQDFIDSQTFSDLCIEKQVPSKDVERLKDFFNNLGIFVHFPDLSDDALLNPKWLTYSVYCVLRQAEVAEKKGWITEDAIRDHLRKGEFLEDGTRLEYPIEKINALIINCILKFKLGYRVRYECTDYLVMPSVLDKNEPEHDFNRKQSAIHFVFDFKVLLPPYLLHAFVSRSSAEILNHWAWQSGVVLKNETVTALVENFHTRKIDIYIAIEHERNRKKATLYLDKLLDRFLEIIRGEEGSVQPDYDMLVEIPTQYYHKETVKELNANRMVSYVTLQGAREDGDETLRTDFGKFDVQKFLGDYPMNENKSEFHIGDTIFNNGGEIYKAGKNQTIVRGDQMNVRGVNKDDTIEKLIPLLQTVVDVVSENKTMRYEMRDITQFLNELKNYPHEIESKEIEDVKKKFESKQFIEKVDTFSSVSANLITIAQQIVPLLAILASNMS